MKMTIKEIANKLKMDDSTLRTWLGNYRFSKHQCQYCNPTMYNIGYYFWVDLNDFLENKYSPIAHKIKQYISEELKK